jgi:hypothetical protein
VPPASRVELTHFTVDMALSAVSDPSGAFLASTATWSPVANALDAGYAAVRHPARACVAPCHPWFPRLPAARAARTAVPNHSPKRTFRVSSSCPVGRVRDSYSSGRRARSHRRPDDVGSTDASRSATTIASPAARVSAMISP